MAGFAGICGSELSALDEGVKSAVESTVYSAKTSVAHLQSDNNLLLSKSFFHFFDQARCAASSGDVHVWIDGEIYNEDELEEGNTAGAAAVLLNSYQQGSIDGLLPRLDGVFTAIIYDTEKKLLTVVTDRYGLKPFYFYRRNRKLMMAPELKCFTFFRDFDLRFRSDLMDCFIDLGHLMGNDTWFEGVELLDPSSVFSYDIKTDTLTTRKYWTWADNPRNFKISIDDAASEMARLLRQAIRSRAKGPARMGISLSGGLDSRAILASVYQDIPVFTYTFGLKESADVTIARQVADAAGVENRHFDINVKNWLDYRFFSVWKTDGMLNLYHMHYPHIMNEVQQLIDINLSGFSGDLVLGGSYLEKTRKIFFTKKFLNQRINADIAKVYYGRHYVKCDPQDPFFNIDCIDPYQINNRCRRFVIMGIEDAAKLIPQRMPFLANDLMELSYSLPDEYRYNSNVYNRALQQYDPLLFSTIPNASTGMPVTEKPTLLNQLRWKLDYYKDIVKVKLGKPISFVDYHHWVKEPTTASLIGELLDPKKALYAQFTDKDYKALYLEPHLKGPRFYTQKILSALTIEIWLQQILNKKYQEPKL
jgi:asparagine synthase (glutamine-hydrolysing)